MQNAFMTPAGLAKVSDECEAHRAYLAQLREERDRRGAPVLRFADTETQQLLDSAETRGDVRKYSGAPLTGFGAPDFGQVLRDIREVDQEEAEIEARDRRIERGNEDLHRDAESEAWGEE